MKIELLYGDGSVRGWVSDEGDRLNYGGASDVQPMVESYQRALQRQQGEQPTATQVLDFVVENYPSDRVRKV